MAALSVAASAALVFARPFRKAIIDAFRVPTFVVLAVLLPTVIVGLYADRIRHRAVLALGPRSERSERGLFLAALRLDYECAAECFERAVM
jgi:hypothetical protein